MKTNLNQTEAKKFTSYSAKLESGAVVHVINQNDNATIKATGEKIVALKVQERFKNGYRGWSGGAQPNYVYGTPFWIRASKVVGARL